MNVVEIKRRIREEEKQQIKEIGERLKTYRLDNNIPQGDMANALGMSQGFLSSVEDGRYKIGYPVLKRLIVTYEDLDIKWLITGVETHKDVFEPAKQVALDELFEGAKKLNVKELEVLLSTLKVLNLYKENYILDQLIQDYVKKEK